MFALARVALRMNPTAGWTALGLVTATFSYIGTFVSQGLLESAAAAEKAADLCRIVGAAVRATCDCPVGSLAYTSSVGVNIAIVLLCLTVVFAVGIAYGRGSPTIVERAIVRNCQVCLGRTAVVSSTSAVSKRSSSLKHRAVDASFFTNDDVVYSSWL